MKKRLVVVALGILLLGLGAAVAIGGSAGDPLVTQSYLENVYSSSLVETMRKKAEELTQKTYSAAVSRLDSLGEEDIAAAQGGYTAISFQEGDSLDVQTGGSLVLFSGGGRVTAGTLADVTTGNSVAVGGTLEASHRYIITSAGTASVVGTKAGTLGWQGIGQKRSVGALPFADVADSAWYHDAVAFVYARGYFSGTGGQTFSPEMTMTRGMLATVLYRLSGESGSDAAIVFQDVPKDAWYAAGVSWASSHHIVEGMGNGLYAPDKDVTREQIVAMLYRYQKNYLEEATAGKGDLSAFADSDSISSWARDAMTWAVGEGLVTGRAGGVLDPTGSATRSEVAVMVTRFAQFIEK